MHVLLKIAKGLLYLLLGIIILLVLAVFFADPIVEKLLENRVSKAGKGQFSVEFGEVNVSVLAGNIVLDDVFFNTANADTTISPQIMTRADRVAIKGFDWLRYLAQQELILDQLELKNLELQLKASQKDTSGNPSQPFRLEQLDIYPSINQQLDKVFLNDLSFDKISLEFINFSSGDTLRFDAAKFGLQSEDILIEANSLITNDRAFYAERIDLDGRDIEITRSGRKYWKAVLEAFQLDTKEEKVSAALRELEFFTARHNHEDTLLYTRLGILEAEGLDLNQLQQSKAFFLKNVVVEDVLVVQNKQNEALSIPPSKTPVSGARFPIGEVNLAKMLPAFIEEIGINDLKISNFTYEEKGGPSLYHLDAVARDVTVGGEVAFFDNRFLHASFLELGFEKLKVKQGNPVHQILLKGFELQADNGIASIGLEQIVVEPEEEPKGKVWVDADIAALQVDGINYSQLAKGSLSIDSIGILDPEIIVHLPASSSGKNKKAGSGRKPDLYPLIAGYLQQLEIEEMALLNGDIRLAGLGGTAEGAALPVVYIQFRDIQIAEGTAYKDDRLLHAGDVSMYLENLHYLFPNNVYVLELGVLKASTAEEQLEARDFSFAYNENYEKILNGPKSNSIYKITYEELLIKGLEYEKLLTGKGFMADLVAADKVDFYSLKDFNKPEELKVKPMPQEAIKNLNFPLNVRKLMVSDADIVYEEKKKGADTSGVIRFMDVSVRAQNITNLRPLLLKNSELPVIGNGQLMGQGYFETELLFYMLSDSNKVRVSGAIDTLNLAALNPIARYNSMAAIESGTLYRAEWDFVANVEQSHGTMLMRYDNLDIQLSSQKSPDTTGILKDIGSFLANKLLVESDRAEDKDDEPEKVDFTQERNKEKSFLNYYWKSLLAGLKELIGPF
ncbi:AsmA family protein [Nafulsella turpanensis]|uniref:hypothetical protein n=1 Tax=Nafulsella turpanensis TaxID=1265690 RepID=UPI000380E408|nr:hypothetical protein [Nafulsella turpanensis]